MPPLLSLYSSHHVYVVTYSFCAPSCYFHVPTTCVLNCRLVVVGSLIFRKPKSELIVNVTTSRDGCKPNDPVTLIVKTTTAAGVPVPATVGVSVVDDTVIQVLDFTFVRSLS